MALAVVVAAFGYFVDIYDLILFSIVRLASLRELHDKFGISLIYITHDLTTAYQVSQNVIVLYRGLVAEAGDVEKVVGDPKHPYTRLLIGSIPYPDPNRPWTGEEAPSPEGVGAPPEQSCCFAPRCPLAMAVCRETYPPTRDFGTGGSAHRVDCHL